MYCPFCGHQETKVVDSRLAGDGYQTRRRRECIECSERFTTFESAELVLPKLIKRDESREPFNESKLRAGILVATEKGYGKRTDVIQYRTQTRGGKGVLTMRCTDKTGKMVKIMEVVDSDDLIVITDAGVLMRQPVGAIRTIGRVTQGVRLVKLDDGSIISSITRVMQEAEKTEEIDKTEEDAQIEIDLGESDNKTEE